MKTTDEILAILEPQPKRGWVGPLIFGAVLSLPFWARMIWEFTR